MDLGAELRKAIENAGVSVYRVALESGVPQAVLSRFVRGERDITVQTASKLLGYFGAKVVIPKRRRAKT